MFTFTAAPDQEADLEKARQAKRDHGQRVAGMMTSTSTSMSMSMPTIRRVRKRTTAKGTTTSRSIASRGRRTERGRGGVRGTGQ